MEFDLARHTILLTVCGSRAYGMHTPDSDVDVKGVCIAPMEYYLGFVKRFEQADKASHMMAFYHYLNAEEQEKADNGELEGSVYDVRKFIKLAADANPNILDVLFCRDKEIRVMTSLGEKLRANRNLFLSTKIKHTFSGYSFAQLKRIKTHRRYLLNPPKSKPTRSEFGLPENRKLLRKDEVQAVESVIRKKMDEWEIDFKDMSEADKIYIQGQIEKQFEEVIVNQDDKYIAAARAVGLDDNLVEFVLKERNYNAKMREWKQYQEWRTNRNPERAAMEAESGYDRKHASHLVRLLRTCREVLETGVVNVYRPDADELLEIRGGGWTYEQIIEFAEREDKELDNLYKKSLLPRSPDRNKLDELCIEIIEEFNNHETPK
jgi:predicted nucleotidyltransferase